MGDWGRDEEAVVGEGSALWFVAMVGEVAASSGGPFAQADLVG